MFELIVHIIQQIPYIIPGLITLALVWILIGWLLTHVFGFEVIDVLVMSLVVFLILLSLFLLTNRNAQMIIIGIV